jgi:hypothetical protein
MAITANYIKIHLDETGRLIIRKRKLVKYGRIAISLVLPMLLALGPTAYVIWEYKSKHQSFQPPTPVYIVITVMAAVSLWMTWRAIKLVIVDSSTISLSIKERSVYINDVFFCSKADLQSATIQTIPDREPQKFFYNIGIVAGKKFAPLLFSKTYKKAKAAENIIAHYLAGESIEEDIRPFMSLEM